MNRIHFVVLFGIATSIELFHERLSRSATRSLYGAQFDVEQTSRTLEKVFRRALAGQDACLYLGSGIVASLLERQYNQVQSIQAFVSALKVCLVSRF
jgi:origin recognition complex subunit 3